MKGPVKLKAHKTIKNAKCAGIHHFKCGNDVPIYEIFSMHELNQIIGYAKFLNQDYGSVFYRGQCELYDTLIPSLYRRFSKMTTATEKICRQNNLVYGDSKLFNELKLAKDDPKDAKCKIEGILQHYGAPTRFLDLVDNHWISLWMGLYRYVTKKKKSIYCYYEKRTIPEIDYIMKLFENIDVKNRRLKKDKAAEFLSVTNNAYQYVLLVALPFFSVGKTGILRQDNLTLVDLRIALPSIFLRPHAQHALVVKKDDASGKDVDFYDMAEHVVGILKIRTDYADEWMGNGLLLTQENLFPSPIYDEGYDVLLSRSDLFENPFGITRYI